MLLHHLSCQVTKDWHYCS